jgi:hypothetical protein
MRPSTAKPTARPTSPTPRRLPAAAASCSTWTTTKATELCADECSPGTISPSPGISTSQRSSGKDIGFSRADQLTGGNIAVTFTIADTAESGDIHATLLKSTGSTEKETFRDQREDRRPPVWFTDRRARRRGLRSSRGSTLIRTTRTASRHVPSTRKATPRAPNSTSILRRRATRTASPSLPCRAAGAPYCGTRTRAAARSGHSSSIEKEGGSGTRP